MLNKANIQPMTLTGWSSFNWLFIALLFLILIPSAMAQIVIPNESAAAFKSSLITQSDNIRTKNVSIEKLLQNFVQHGSSQLFDGIFVYLFEDTIQTIKVHRKVNENGEVVEQFIPLDSSQKKSTRVLVNQYCSLNNGWQYQFQAISSSFPFRINNLYLELQENYGFSVSDVKTVAGTSAIGLYIKPKDPYRYGYQLWFEPQTSTLLKYKLLDQKNKVIEQYVFTDINFKNNPASATSAGLPSESTSCQEQFKGITKAYKKYFFYEKIPKGYEPVSFRKGFINNSEHLAYQFQFSDGISSVSIFIEEMSHKKAVNGVLKLGPVNVAGKTIGHHQITVLGAIPIASALRFLKAIKEPVND